MNKTRSSWQTLRKPFLLSVFMALAATNAIQNAKAERGGATSGGGDDQLNHYRLLSTEVFISCQGSRDIVIDMNLNTNSDLFEALQAGGEKALSAINAFCFSNAIESLGGNYTQFQNL